MSMRHVGPNTPSPLTFVTVSCHFTRLTHHGYVEERNYTQNFNDINHFIITTVISCDDEVQGSKHAS